MNRILIALLALGVTGAAVPAFAGDGSSGSSGDCAVCSKTTSDSWGVKTTSQLARGAANTGGCWLEMANQPMKEHRAGGNLAIGVAKGFGHTCLRLVKGVGEIVTAPMPKAKDGSQIATDCPICMWSA
jgi:putative exosortase-associated protein (TIGR04073 family)